MMRNLKFSLRNEGNNCILTDVSQNGIEKCNQQMRHFIFFILIRETVFDSAVFSLSFFLILLIRF